MNTKDALVQIGSLHAEFVKDLKQLVAKYTSNDLRAAFAIAAIDLSQCRQSLKNNDDIYNFNQITHKLEDQESRLSAYVNVIAAMREPISWDFGPFLVISIAEILQKAGKLSEEDTLEIVRRMKK